jgi:hypothetical protein
VNGVPYHKPQTPADRAQAVKDAAGLVEMFENCSPSTDGMKSDPELEKIAGVMRRLDEVYDFFLRGDFSASDYKRMKAYIRQRKPGSSIGSARNDLALVYYQSSRADSECLKG